MAKVICIVSDGLRDDIAAQQMGYLEQMVESEYATRYTVVAGLPTMSRPLYETLHTGVPSSEHGITSNAIVRLSRMPNVFQVLRDAGKTTAAAAYCWYSELYNRAPYDRVNDRETDDPSLPIQHGRFYSEDAYPDTELFAAAAMLVRRHMPDYLLLHPMSMDFVGEAHGGTSGEYRRQAINQDAIIGTVMPEWLALGYTVLVTADHGMSDFGDHGGTLPSMRHVPLYILRPDHKGRGNTRATVSQFQIAPTVLTLIGVPVPGTMTHPPIEV